MSPSAIHARMRTTTQFNATCNSFPVLAALQANQTTIIQKTQTTIEVVIVPAATKAEVKATEANLVIAIPPAVAVAKVVKAMARKAKAMAKVRTAAKARTLKPKQKPIQKPNPALGVTLANHH